MRIFVALLLGLMPVTQLLGNGNVHVSRFWHNHQPIYWPEWNGNGAETERVQFAWDSIVLKPGQTYSSGVGHPENDLGAIFGIDDRKNSYQFGPRNALASLNENAGFTMSYSGSLMENVRNLGLAGQLGYGANWWDGFREAVSWTTPSGGPRMDMAGFTYHHSLGAVLPKAVLRKEIQIFKEVWWKAWKGSAQPPEPNAHSKGFFPTEMAFSRHMVDVLVDEGYDWVIVASHHLSRTCPTYFDQFDLANNDYGIFSSPPNRADLLGPSPTSGWWYSEPNPGNAAWNVSPHAYQLHRARYVDPATGAEKTMLMVPSDDVLSYRYGYSNEGIGKIQQFIAPFATDANRPVMVMPSSDGDNAWGGGSSSWFEATPQLFNDSGNAGFKQSTAQDFVNAHGAAAPVAHVEDGAWIFPESDYGSPYFLKWVEPPIKTTTATNTYPGTLVDMETPGFALKFFSWAPVISGANWCETAEQIWTDKGGTVANYKIQGPYDWFGGHTSPNIIERAWHIYLAGLDSGFNYYGGLGNDDEVKSSLATRRAVEMLQSYMTANIADDATGPSIFKPQRFPYNPGAYTFGWFNSVPGGDTRYLKKMPSQFYIWTHVYDVSGVSNVTLRVRLDNDGVNPLANNQNETFAGGAEVGSWVSIPMTKRILPNTQATLNAAANNGQINYFPEALSPEIADYYFAKITDATLASFRGTLIDYYIESTDMRGNWRHSDIQHVYVEDDGLTGGPIAPEVVWTPDSPTDCPGSVLDVRYRPNDGPLSNSAPITLAFALDADAGSHVMTASNGWHVAQITITSGLGNVSFSFSDGGPVVDDNGGAGWSLAVRACPAPSLASINPPSPDRCGNVVIAYDPGTDLLSDDQPIIAHLGVNAWQTVASYTMIPTNGRWELVYEIVPGVDEINAAFRNEAGDQWDNHGGADWNWAVTGCEGSFDPDSCAFVATPAVSGDPADGADQNNTGDNFDLSRYGGALKVNTQGGFGAFGSIFVNTDAQALYLGGYNLQPGGSNDVAALFLGVNTLGRDLNTLWDMNGAPNALDLLHNVVFTQPMDLAILIGDEFGDGNFANFSVAGGYDHGQGVFHFGTTSFVAVAGAQLSQFDGTNAATATASADDDGGDRQTDRWEVRIPWADLSASGPTNLTELWVAGLLLSDYADGVDRYLSGNYLGDSVTSEGELDQNGNYGTGIITLTPIAVCLPHQDGDDDGLFNAFELTHFGNAGSADAGADTDGDGHTAHEEQRLGTQPTNALSALRLYGLDPSVSGTTVSWTTSGGRFYMIEINDDPMLSTAAWTNLQGSTEDDVPDGVETTESLLDTSATNTTQRAYRISFP